MKLQGRIVLPNMFLRDVNEELQMYFIAYECHNPATGHLTKQDRNSDIFENYSNLLKVFFSYMFYLYYISVGSRITFLVKLTSCGFWKWSLIECIEVELIFHASGLFLFMFNDRQMAFLTLGSCFLFDTENDGLPVCVDTWYIKMR